MSGLEFRKWQAMHLLEPFGDERRQMAGIEAAVKNAFGGKQGGGHFTPDECLPVPKRDMTDDVIAAKLNAMLGSKVSGKKDDCQ